MAGKYALIIACSDYQDERLHRLPKTEADAAGIREVLTDPRLCGFPEGHVERQVNAPEGSIRVAIERFFKHREREDLLILYFAGHGIIDDHRRLTLALNETDPDYRATGIDARFLREEMENCRSDRQVLILDCCNAGAFARGRDAKGAPAGLQEALKGKGRFVLAASDKLQLSFDEVAGRETIPNGIFTHYLIEGLRGFKAVSANGRAITATSLYSYAHEAVARETERRQTPVLILPDEKRIGDVVLANKPSPQLPETLRALLDHADYTQRLAGAYQLRDAVRGGEEYADAARDALREMADKPQHRLVHRAIDEVLAEFEGEGGPASKPEPKRVEPAVQQHAAVKPSPKPILVEKRWAIMLVIIAIIAVGGVVYYISQDGEEVPPEVVVDRQQPAVKPPEAAQETNKEAARHEKKALRKKQIASLLKSAADKLRTRNLTIPRSGQERAALDDYRAVLALDPDNVKALGGVSHIAEYFAGRAEEAIDDKQWHPAEELLNKAADIDARLPVLTALRERLATAQRRETDKKADSEKAFKAGEDFRDKLKSGGEGPSMVVIPAGEFLMGSPPSEPVREENEGPQHQVRIEQPFAIGKYEVTFEEYDAFAQTTQREKPNDLSWGRGRRPVISVSWEEATAYAKWLSDQTGKPYRLPSEAEWEYAARAGTTTPFHTGKRITTDQANFNGNYTYNSSAKGEYRKKTVSVGSFPANAFGLHDVHGNVWEWVQDCWHGNYQDAPADGSAWESGDCAGRLLRSGSWLNAPGWLRSATRDGFRPTHRFGDRGFRLARTL